VGRGGILFLQISLAQIFLFKNTVFLLSEFLSATVLFVSFPPHQSAHYFFILPSAETKKPVQIEKFLQVTSKRRERNTERERERERERECV
jgi:hypothetical protein